MVAAAKIFIGLLLISNLSSVSLPHLSDLLAMLERGSRDGNVAQKSSNDSIHTSLIMVLSMSSHSLVSLLLLGLTVVLSGSIYIWVLRYVCIGCCQPTAVGTEAEVLAGMV